MRGVTSFSNSVLLRVVTPVETDTCAKRTCALQTEGGELAELPAACEFLGHLRGSIVISDTCGHIPRTLASCVSTGRGTAARPHPREARRAPALSPVTPLYTTPQFKSKSVMAARRRGPLSHCDHSLPPASPSTSVPAVRALRAGAVLLCRRALAGPFLCQVIGNGETILFIF